MRFPAIVAVLFFAMCTQSFGQIFPNAPWNRTSSDCYQDASGNTICPGVARSVVTVAPAPTVTYSYPSVSSSVTYGSTGGAALSNGSSGGTSLSPTKAPDPNSVSILARRSDFRKAFLSAVKEARESDQISALQHGRLVIASLRPRELANIEAWCHENAVQEGLATPSAIDWDNLIAFIEKLIPLIIQLIDLFGANVGDVNEVQYATLPVQFEHFMRDEQCDWIGTVSLSA